MAKNGENIASLLSRNVEQIIEENHLREALALGKKLRVKFGIDPTSADLHLGHAIVLRKLREFQDIGSTAILVIGDFTAQIGDPSGRDKTRPPLTKAEVRANMKNYLKQASKIIDVEKAEIVYNSEWLEKLKGERLFALLGMVSLQQIVEREDFQKRLAMHHSIRMQELFYPIMQAYDSIAIKADVELGGTDQTFNLLMGRNLMEKMGMKPQDVMTMPILEGTDGKHKMSKSLGNYIGLTESPDEMFGKIMSLPDTMVERYYKLGTLVPPQEIANMVDSVKRNSAWWKDIKVRLGFEIVKLYHGERSAEHAQKRFEKLFFKKEIPDDISELKVKKENMSAVEVVLAAGAKSKSDARRLIEQGGFHANGETRKDPTAIVSLRTGDIIKIGKKRFYRVRVG